MEKTARDHVVRALNELEKDSFKRFRNKLTDCTVKEGYTTIPKGHLEDVDCEDLTTRILQRYEIPYGCELTIEVLKAINENQVAADLEKNLEKVNGLSWRRKPNEEPQPTADVSSSSTSNTEEEPFVDKYQEELIERVHNVDPILDGLFTKKLITIEDRDIIRAEKTVQARMRKLYDCMRPWSESDKRVLYEILKKKNPILVRNLEKS